MLLAWQWYDSHQQINALQLELARRLAAADVENKESRGVVAQVREATLETQVKLGVLEGKLQESQNQQIALEALYQELSRSRDESLLTDVEQTLLVASQQLQIAAVTGTNGKTTTAMWLAQALSRLGRKCGVVGTLGIGQPGAMVFSGLTTPDPVLLQLA